ncbi:MAG: hypothetical protein MK030_08995, partial [SAR116 cluster bacterium]|nr:hypothetical protein [SAR116 cluster bacterium]
MINLVPRKEIPLSLTLSTTAVAVALTLIAGAAIFGVLGYDPLAALYQFFIAPVSRGYQVADLFVKACPLIIIASGLVFSYRANVWNIGAEGQMILGAMFSGYVALYWGGMPAPLLLPTMILAGDSADRTANQHLGTLLAAAAGGLDGADIPAAPQNGGAP